MYYVIGDVHGQYELLMDLESQLPPDANLIFVGDLIDRGPDSKEIIRFVRENGCQCVRGNHEEYMINQGQTNNVPWCENIYFYEWLENGGMMTLFSYGIIGEYEKFFNNPDNENHIFFDDTKWLSTLPYYIELDSPKVNGRNVVISHSSIGNMWYNRHGSEFKKHVIFNRNIPTDTKNIFNIFGHTVTKEIVVNDFSASIDTGAFSRKKLSALQIPDLKIFST